MWISLLGGLAGLDTLIVVLVIIMVLSGAYLVLGSIYEKGSK